MEPRGLQAGERVSVASGDARPMDGSRATGSVESKPSAVQGEGPSLTPTQARRLAARIEGQSIASIARADGVSRTAVQHSLAKAGARDMIRDYGEQVSVRTEAVTVDGEAQRSELIPIIQALLNEVCKVGLGATRPMVLTSVRNGQRTQRIEFVEDERLRAETSLRLLELFRDAQADALPSASSNAPPPSVDIVDVELLETKTKHVRERRVRPST